MILDSVLLFGDQLLALASWERQKNNQSLGFVQATLFVFVFSILIVIMRRNKVSEV